jgi:hypothetical protein
MNGCKCKSQIYVNGIIHYCGKPPVLLHCGFHSTEEVQMAVGEWVQMQELSFYRTKSFNLVPG